MERKGVILLVTCLIFGTCSVLFLYAMSEKIVHEPNNFLRMYIPDMTRQLAKSDLRYNSYYFAGATDRNIYLGNYSSPFHLVSTNYALTDTAHIQLNVENIEKFKLTKYLRVSIDSPNFYLMDGLMPGLFQGRIGEWCAKSCTIDSVYFSLSVPISARSFAIRTATPKTRENILGKVSKGSSHINLEPTLLQKQIDGIFCTDGTLNYSKYLNRLVYSYFYRNEYIVYDTNMNLDYRGHTIDTFNTAQIQLANISSENKTVLATPPKFINNGASLFRKYLFVYSGLLAKNDDKRAFEKVSVIDVYDIETNSYKFSFKISAKMRDFKIISDRTLACLYENYLAIYEMNSDFFKEK